MGWGSVFCYRELARTYSHRVLRPLPLGGVFYSVGAVLNLARWPVLVPGVFAAHELFHFFVIAGSACHIFFMIKVVAPSPAPVPLPVRAHLRRVVLEPQREREPAQGRRWSPQVPSHRPS